MKLRAAALPLAVALALAFPLRWAALGALSRMGLDRPYDVPYVPEPGALRILSAPVRLTVADAYWLEAVQYIGEPRAGERGWGKLYPLIDLITDLDPGHGYAYQTGGIVLSSQGRLAESDALLKKGLQPGRPAWWTFPFYLAFNDYFYRGDYASAARWAELAARTPGASPHISQLALSLDVKSGSVDGAIRFLEELRDTARDDATAAALEEQYKLALLQRDFARLDASVARFAAEQGHPARSLDEVRAAGLPAPTTDPFGGRYYLDPKDGKVHATGRDFRFKPPDPGRLQLPPAAPQRQENQP
ncbi:tetratricopeptide repeat protein [Anaeromyxobacter diazotrophicus]|uniref:Tetratricopeptide repeat protein n=1 Tax=Anaeromyxobacter diazotrophicus TaxID=2590199 RepID=A0A7I9VI06_9BACT|nr:tetratricopeptide repeat protein [Anaeromyxobacter diazotrophicus]GEJ55657.1 hypothetical protein AMYX_03980 [Anaeromyxobacter diazotrophicus]